MLLSVKVNIFLGKRKKAVKSPKLNPCVFFIHVGFNFNDSPAFYRFPNVQKIS